MSIMLVLYLLYFFISYPPVIAEMANVNGHQQRRHTSTSLEFTANAVYNKLYQRSLNINNVRVYSIEPHKKVWFAIENGTLFALPLFGDYHGPFSIQFQQQLNNSSLSRSHSDSTTNYQVELELGFNFTFSSSLFHHPSNHLLLALFNMSSTIYNSSPLNHYLIVHTLAYALNLSESSLTIHKINGSMIKVYFSADFYSSTFDFMLINQKNFTQLLRTLIDRYYSRRLQLLPHLQLPLIEISIVRTFKQTTIRPIPISIATTTNITTTTTTTPITTSPHLDIKKAIVTIGPRFLSENTMKPNRTVTSTNGLILLDQLYQPLVIVPLSIIAIGLFICAVIAFCLCCNRRSSSSSTLLLPSGPSGSPNNKHLYQNYSYHKHQQQRTHRKKQTNYQNDQRQFISKGIPVVFAEELEEKLEQTHTPLVMRIEKAPLSDGQEKSSL